MAQTAIRKNREFGEDSNQPVGVPLGELSQQHRVDYAENRRSRTGEPQQQ
jgi:hypothetical protein